MDGFILRARAKLNLTLDVLGIRADGFHEIASVMQSLALNDDLELLLRDDGKTEVVSSHGPSGPENLVFRAVQALREKTGFTRGVKVVIRKRIPLAAGLGGGSADAAAALLALNHLLGLGLTTGQLVALGQEIGSDIPFCLLGGTALVRGRGERLTILPPPPRLWLVLSRPPQQLLPTKEVYDAWDRLGAPRLPSSGRMVAALAGGRREEVVAAMDNHLEPVVLKICPKVAEVKESLLRWGAEKVVLCGSGPTVAAVAPDESAATVLARRAREAGYETWLTHTLV